MLCSTPTQTSTFTQPMFMSPHQQTFTSPQPTITRTPSTLALQQKQEPFSVERECWSVYRDRFKWIIISGIIVQYILLMSYSIVLNIGFLNPLTWIREIFSILFSPLILVIIVHIYFTLRPLLGEKVYYSTRFEKFVRSFKHESLIVLLDFFIGIFTSLLFVRYLGDDFKKLSLEHDGKRYLNQNFAFLTFTGAFMRCYFYFKPSENVDSITFPIIHQSKLLQIRRQIFMAMKTSFKRTLIPLVHCIGFYAFFGGVYKFIVACLFGLNDATVFDHVLNLINFRLLAVGWILSALVWSNLSVMTNLIVIFTTEPTSFYVEGVGILTLADALETAKFKITQQLAAQDLHLLSENYNDIRRKQFYALSNPGAHPTNWKRIVKVSLSLVEKFSDDLKTAVDVICKNRSNNNVHPLTQQPYHQFFEGKRLIREFNTMNGIRNLASAPLIEPTPTDTSNNTNYTEKFKQKLLSYPLVYFLFGEPEDAKLSFILQENAQTIEWVVQALGALVVRSVSEDRFGVVQNDIRVIVKSFLKLKASLEKVSSINSFAKDRQFVSLRAIVRRTLYQFVMQFSKYFDDLLLEPEDVRVLLTFATFKEL